jgi:hypothetical protein
MHSILHFDDNKIQAMTGISEKNFTRHFYHF